MSAWIDMASVPKDGTEIIILFDSATVDIVRLCWWDNGWWSYIHSVTQELIDLKLMRPVGWMPCPEDRP